VRHKYLQRALADVVIEDFRPDVEGLRAIAVVLVLLFHLGLARFSGGFIGVDVFFVLSGFLITRLLLKELHRTGTISLRSFWARRARRLLPASAFVAVVTLVAAHWLLPPLSQQTLGHDAVAVGFFIVNWRFAVQLGDYFGAQLGAANPSPLLHFWSLAVEEQFYLVWPPLMLLVSRRPRHYRRLLSLLVVFIIVASVIASLWMTHTNQTYAFYLLPARMFELLAGAGVALAAPFIRSADARVRAACGWVGLGMIVVVSLNYDATTSFPGIAAAIPVAATVLVLVAGGDGAAHWSPALLLDVPPLQWIGRHSYAIYLWHWPILVLAEAQWGPLGFIGKSLCVLLALGLSALSYQFVENPIRHSGWVIERPRRGLLLGATLCLSTLAVAAVSIAAVPRLDTGADAAAPSLGGAASHAGPGATNAVGDSLPAAASTTSLPAGATKLDRLVAEMQPLLEKGLRAQVVPGNIKPPLRFAADDKARLYNDGCVNQGGDDHLADCRYGNLQSPTTIVLYGDSHAAHWFPAMEKVAADHHVQLVVFTKGGCPDAQVQIIPPGSLTQTCPAWRDKVVQKIQELHPAMVVMSSSYHYPNSDTAWATGIDQIVARLAPLTPDLVILGDNPGASAVPSTCLSQHLRDATFCINHRAKGVKSGRVAAERAAAAAHGARYIETSDWLCTADACPVMLGDILLFRDANHLSTTASLLLAPLVDAALYPN
jgi:peptidoglycan/LPS O-acetylase OafA/YrhL